MVGALAVDQLFDSVAIRVNGPKAWDTHLTIDWVFTDLGTHPPHRAHQRRAHPGRRPEGGDVDLTVTLTKAQLLGLLGGVITLDAVTTDGDTAVVAKLLSFLDPVSGDFPIVTP